MYVAVAHTDDGALVFGSWRSLESAEKFASDVNERIRLREDREFEQYQARADSEEIAPDGYGRVYAYSVLPPNRGAAESFLLGKRA